MKSLFNVIIFFLSGLFFCSCRASLINNERKIVCSKITQTLPKAFEQGSPAGYDTISDFIYSLDKQKIMHIASETVNVDTITGQYIFTGKFSYFDFLFTEGNKTGLVLNRSRKEPEKIVPVDSMLKTQWTSDLNMASLFHDNETQLISSRKTTSSILEEVYSWRGKSDTSLHGKMRLVFSNKKFKKSFSLSPGLDSMKNMILIKVYIVYDARYLKSKNIHFGELETYFGLEEVKNIDEAKILSLFAKEKALKLN